jgi:probable HAF family extracellular repeat protein
MLWVAGNVGEAGTYTVTDITLGGAYSWAYGINASGQVVGYSYTTGGAGHAFLYSGGTTTDLGTLNPLALPSLSVAYGINAGGQIVGYSGFSSNTAFLYSGSGPMTGLGNLPGGNFSVANGINASGQIVGYAATATAPNYDAFLYNSGSATPTMIDLGTLPGGSHSVANGINAGGQIVGYGDNATYGQVAFLYSGGTMSPLGTLGGGDSWANAINDSGQVVGASNLTGNAASHAFLYSGGVMTDLGTLGRNSEALAINNDGDVVGDSVLSNGNEDAFLYSGGVMTDLNTMIVGPSSVGWQLEEATGINNEGQIVGYGLYSPRPYAYYTQAFLLTPTAVPEPISMILFGTGLVGVVGYVSRRRMLRKA